MPKSRKPTVTPLGRRLKAERLHRSLSIRAAAAQLDLSEKGYWLIEAGVHDDMFLSTAVKISKIFGITLNQLSFLQELTRDRTEPAPLSPFEATRNSNSPFGEGSCRTPETDGPGPILSDMCGDVVIGPHFGTAGIFDEPPLRTAPRDPILVRIARFFMAPLGYGVERVPPASRT